MSTTDNGRQTTAKDADRRRGLWSRDKSRVVCGPVFCVLSLSYQPTLYLSQIRATYSALSPQNKPTSSIVNGTRYYWNQTQSGAVTVSVRQVADAEGGTTQPRCRSDFNNFNTWTQLPGSISSAGGRLSIEAEALPVGT